MESQSSPIRPTGRMPPRQSREYSAAREPVKVPGGPPDRPPTARRRRRARRAKRRFPARITRPSRASASRSSSCTGSPSRLTPAAGDAGAAPRCGRPPPGASTRRAGRCTGPAASQHDLGHLLRRPVVADGAVEVGLGRRSGPAPWKRSAIRRAEAALVLARVARRRRLARREQPVPLGQHVVGDAHRAAELLLGRLAPRRSGCPATCSSSGRRRCPAGSASS